MKCDWELFFWGEGGSYHTYTEGLIQPFIFSPSTVPGDVRCLRGPKLSLTRCQARRPVLSGSQRVAPFTWESLEPSFQNIPVRLPSLLHPSLSFFFSLISFCSSLFLPFFFWNSERFLFCFFAVPSPTKLCFCSTPPPPLASPSLAWPWPYTSQAPVAVNTAFLFSFMSPAFLSQGAPIGRSLKNRQKATINLLCHMQKGRVNLYWLGGTVAKSGPFFLFLSLASP